MSGRDADFRRLVPMMSGWTVSEPDGNLVRSLRAFRRADYASFPFPAPDARLPEQLEFVGRIAEALGYGFGLSIHWLATDRAWSISIATKGGGDIIKLWHTGTAPDLAHAAVRAALVAKVAT